ALTKEKDPGVFRILSLGESTTFGLGYDGIASYSRFLEARLRTRLGRDDVDVVNCGKSGYDSHDWPTLARERPGLAPGLLAIYGGHNELKSPNLGRLRAPLAAWLWQFRLLRPLVRWDDRPPAGATLPEELADAPFLRDDERARAIRRFEAGVRSLLD